MKKETNILGFSMGALGNNLISGAVSTYLLTFYTDVFGLPATIAGVIMLIARVWDGVNDPMIGLLADRRQGGKNGKYRPLMKIFGPLFAIFAVLSFCSPELPMIGKVCWATVTYIAYGMCFTCFDVPFWASINRMNVDQDKRNNAIALSRSMIMWAMMIATTFFDRIVSFMGGGNQNLGYPLAMLVFAVPGVILMLISYSSVREVEVEETRSTDKVNFADMFRNLFSILTPQLTLSYLANMLTTLAVNLGPMAGVYFMVYYIAKPEMISVYMFLCMFPIAIASLAGGFLQRYFSEKRLIISCYLIAAAANLGAWFIGDSNIIFTFVLVFISGLAAGVANVPMMSLIWKFANQASEEKHVRADATVMSLNSLAIKIAQAFAGVVITTILSITGYVANVEQSAAAKTGILQLRSIIPAIFLLVAAVIVIVIREKKTEK